MKYATLASLVLAGAFGQNTSIEEMSRNIENKVKADLMMQIAQYEVQST